MSTHFHPGELRAQRLAGTRGVADELVAGMSSTVPAGSRFNSLLSSLPFLSVTSVTPATSTHPHMLWVSLLFGRHFISAPNPNHLNLHNAAVLPNDILQSNLSTTPAPVAILALDFMNRMRYRTNGQVLSPPTDSVNTHHPPVVTVNIREAFPNCPKYIQKRRLRPETELLPAIPDHPSFEEDTSLSEHDRNLITSADTFFLGTYFKGTGADANQRGGNPGFVRVVSENELFWPDYRGNGMFQSFGNLQLDSRAGLTFFDFSTGHLLQLSGSAEVEWQVAKDMRVERAAERIVRYRVDKVRRSVGPVTNFRWETVEYSPYNPKRPGASEEMGLSASEFPMDVDLVKIVEEAPDIKTFRFLAPRYVKFLPGQYATFDFGNVGVDDDTNVVRTWTLSETANSTKGDVTLEVTVKRKAGGFMSNWLHDNAKLGFRTRLVDIGGDMTVFSAAGVPRKVMFISGGIGITPNMAMLRGIGARLQGNTDDLPDVLFVHQERHRDGIPFRKELFRRANVSGGKTRLHVFISGENKNEIEREGHVRVRCGRIDDDVVEEFCDSDELRERMIYLCGPMGFMEKVTASLVRVGVGRDQIVTEQFNF